MYEKFLMKDVSFETSLRIYFVIAYVEMESYPCADYKPGEDDLQNFDMIRKFQLDVNLDGYPGVTRVRGSNRMQTAYRIDSTANLRMPTM